MKPKRASLMLAGSLALGLLGPVPGQAWAEHEDDKAKTTAIQGRDEHLKDARLERASVVIGTIAKNEKNNNVGRVMDLIVDSRQGQVGYAIMRFGEWFDQSKLFAVPYSALKLHENGKNFKVDITKDQLEKVTSFDKNSYPDMSNLDWAKQVHQQFNAKPYWELDAGQSADTPRRGGRDSDLARLPQLRREYMWANRVNDILGKPVITVSADAQGKHDDLGRVKDLVIDVKHGQVAYAVISHAGDLEKLSMVPWSAMEPNPDKDRFSLRTSKDVLAQAAFKEGAWPDMKDAAWARTVHQRFNTNPYWQVYGFAGETEWDPAWKSDSAYNKLFQQEHVKTVRGKVTKIDTFMADKNSSKGRMIVLKTDDGMEHTIHLGPAQYIDRDNTKFRIREGDELTVTGSFVKFEGDTVVIANRVRKGTESLDLRNREGKPSWDRNVEIDKDSDSGNP